MNTLMRWHTAGRAQNKQKNGAHGCVMWREGCETGSKQERDFGVVEPRYAGRMGTKCERFRVRARLETKWDCILL